MSADVTNTDLERMMSMRMVLVAAVAAVAMAIAGGVPARVGVRAGYTFAPTTSDWYLDTMRLPGGPKQGMEGAFVRVIIGGGTRMLPRGGDVASSR